MSLNFAHLGLFKDSFVCFYVYFYKKTLPATFANTGVFASVSSDVPPIVTRDQANASF